MPNLNSGDEQLYRSRLPHEDPGLQEGAGTEMARQCRAAGDPDKLEHLPEPVMRCGDT